MKVCRFLNQGFGLLETVIAIGIFSVMALTGVSTILHSYTINRLSDEETEARLFAQEGIEAVRSIRNQAWSNLSVGSYGVDSSGGSWIFSGSSDMLSAGGGRNFTRVVTVDEVQRNGGNDIVTSGGTVDSNTMKVTSTTSWNFTPTRSNTVSLVTYLTNFTKSISGDWSNPSQEGIGLNFSGSNNGWKVVASGNYAYVARNGGNPDFLVIDVTNTASPLLIGSLNLSGNQRNIALSGNYAYVVGTGTELSIIDVSTPSAPSLIGSYNAPGRANMLGVYVVGNTAYLSRDSNYRDELYIVNVNNPSSPTLLGSLEIGSDSNEVYVSGNYAYLAVDGSSELQVVDISTPSSPFIVGSLNLTGGNNGETITGFGTTVVLGRSGSNGYLHTIDVSTPTAPSLLGTYSATDDIRDISLGNGNSYVFLGTDDNNSPGEFQVVDISTLSSPTLLGSFDFNNDINGVYYHEGKDRVFGVTDRNSEEFVVIQPQ